MDEVTAANPAAVDDVRVDDAAATVAGATDTEAVQDQPEADANADGVNDEPELEEYELDGKTYRIDPALKGHLLRDADYRKKTMTLAEERRVVEAERATVMREAEVSRQERAAFARLDSLSENIRAFDQVDWDAAFDVDPADAAKAHARQQRLREEYNQLAQRLDQHIAARAQEAQRDTATRREQTLQEAARTIPNWTDTLHGEIKEYAAKAGYEAEDLDNATTRDLRMLNLARIGQQFIDRQRVAAKLAQQARTRPAPEVGGNAGSGSLDPGTLSMADYVRAREAGKI